MTETVAAPERSKHRRSTSCVEGFRGVVIEPSSASTTRRALSQRMFDRKPATILRPRPVQRT